MELIHNTYRKIRDKIFTFLYSFSFNKLAYKATISMPFRVDGARYISIEKDVFIRPNAWLLSVKDQHCPSFQIKLSIGEKTYIGRKAHIVALKKISISNNVLIGDNVYISDNFHRFDRVDIPFKDQGVGFKSEVEIDEGTWIGENVCIISAKIGKNCIIGANSVVLNDLPDYCMAVGSPAKIIKTFDSRTNTWEKISDL